LSKLVLGPVADRLANKRLLIVSEGALQYVPFAALPVLKAEGRKKEKLYSSSPPPSALRPPPLIVEHEIVNLPSASVLGVLRAEIAGRKPAEKVVAVFADPVLESNDPRVKENKDARAGAEEQLASKDLLRSAEELGVKFERLPNTRREAQAIAAQAGKENELTALDFEASRKTVIGIDLDRYQIIHFATHGILNSRHPELSGIVLSLVDENGKTQDGFVRAHEIYNLKLRAELVVLSACRTALGKEVRGEGLVGLVRGFMYAGAARVVASMWDVRDEATAELMKRFYEGMLKGGKRPAAALREAQVKMWRDARWRAPYYWAGFVLQGEWK
jgi:CHAT domain-containing protein